MNAETDASGRTEPSLGPRIEDFSPGTEKIAKALELATRAHEGQKRATGDPYVTHCIAVAQIIEGWGIEDEDLISAALLHDVPEESAVSLKEIEESFGAVVAELVDGVSEFRSVTGESDDRETRRKVLVKSYINPKVAMLKLGDRLHNMRTLWAMPARARIAKSRETLDVYTGLAESLGMWEVKIELEDLAFQYVEPEVYTAIKSEVDADPRLSPSFLGYWKSNLERLLAEAGFNGRVVVRNNGYYNLSEKRRREAQAGKSRPDSFSKINDLVSLRVFLPELADCYRFIGAVHGEFGEVVDFARYDEFVGANKRSNGYSALQTTLNLPQGATEIAVVTEEMEAFNRWGVVSLARRGEQELSQYALKLVFTPTGEVRFLAPQATGVDFACSLNERLGAQAESLLVDGEEQPLSYIIPNASTVEVILTDEVRRAPDADLLDYCLPETRHAIERQLIAQERDRYVAEGKEAMEGVLETRGVLDLGDLNKPLAKGNPLTKLVYWFGCQSVEDLHFKVGGGYLGLSEVAGWLDKEMITKENLGWTTVRVAGADEPGILEDLAAWIHDKGGNIINIGLMMMDGKYELRLVVEGMDSQGEESIRGRLAVDRRFQRWKLV